MDKLKTRQRRDLGQVVSPLPRPSEEEIARAEMILIRLQAGLTEIEVRAKPD